MSEESEDKQDESVQVDADIDRKIMASFVTELERRMREDGKSMSAAELELIRKFLDGAGVSVDSVKRGRFGKRLQEISHNLDAGESSDKLGAKLPFDESGNRIVN